MFNNNKKQYINILKQNKQLKIHYKILQNNQILKEEQSSFLITSKNLPKDAEFKLNTLQKNINHTYIASITENPNQNIILTNNIDVVNYDSVTIGKYHSVIIPKNEVNLTSQYFEKTGVDFILSPFTIIEKYLENNKQKNSLNLFIYNNIIYLIIYNSNKELTLSKTKVLTPFELTQDETFLEDDILGQKLYEEVNFLEIEQFLNETVEQYYAYSADVEFLETIEMLYTLRPMSDEQITTLQDSLLIPISYKSISVDHYIDEIVQKDDSISHNFISVRQKKAEKNIYLWSILALITTAFFIGFVLFNFDQKELEPIKNEKQTETIQTQKPIQKEIEITPIEPTVVLLPDHKNINIQMEQNVKMLFGVIPYDAVLKDIEINKDTSTYVSNFIVSSNSLIDMQSKLKNIYSSSKILLENQNEIILNTIIQNNTLLNSNDTIPNKEYQEYKLLSTSEATTYLLGLTIKESIIKFDGKERNDYLTYNFSIISTVTTPSEFFDFIKRLSMQKTSIELAYPMIFSRKNDSIEIKYKVKIHQQNKQQVSPIK
ncbi:MAG: hypothetical protein WA945_01350 [Arcobacteraceae bacterium]